LTKSQYYPGFSVLEIEDAQKFFDFNLATDFYFNCGNQRDLRGIFPLWISLVPFVKKK